MRYNNLKTIEWFLISLPLLLGLLFLLYSTRVDPDKLLLHAAQTGKMESTKRLILEKKANVNYETHLGITPLMLASGRGDIELARFLISQNAHLDKRDQLGRTAAIYAAMNNHIEMLRFLARNGANLTLAAESGLSVYTIARTNNLIQEALDTQH